jgi:hypothetical protein
MIRKRPKFQRVIRWPINFWRVFRIPGVLSIKQRAFIAFNMANAIAKH